MAWALRITSTPTQHAHRVLPWLTQGLRRWHLILQPRLHLQGHKRQV